MAEAIFLKRSGAFEITHQNCYRLLGFTHFNGRGQA